MSWVKVDDQFFRHPKVITAGRDARDLYLAGLCYCAQGLTDGFIPGSAVRLLAAEAEIDTGPASAERLIAVGLWERVEGGFAVHDYLEYQPSREGALATREARAEAGRRGGKQKASNLLDKNASKTVANSKQNSTPYPYPSRTHPLPPTGGEVGAVGNVGGGATSAPKRRGKRAETPAPDSFPITDDLAAWANETVPEIDLERETRRFLDSARSKGRTYVDWVAAWRGWMTNDFPKALKSGVLGRPATTGGAARASPDLVAQQPPRTRQNIEALRRVGHAIRGLPGATAPAGGGDEQGAQRPANHAVVEEIPPPR